MSVRNSSKRGIANDNSSERRLVEGADVEAVLAVRGVHPLDDDVAHSRDERAGFGHVAEIDLDRRKQQVPDLDVAGEYVLDGASARAVRLDAQTSPVSKTQSSMRTSRHDSGSQPSVLGPCPMIVTRRIVTFVQRVGCSTQKGALRMVTPSMRMFLLRYGSTNAGRRK